MEFFDCHLGIGKFFNRNPFIFFSWESFLVYEIVNCVFDAFQVNDVFHFGFFNTRDDFGRRWRYLFLRRTFAFVIGVKKTLVEDRVNSLP